jgi:hypothetical protein
MNQHITRLRTPKLHITLRTPKLHITSLRITRRQRIPLAPIILPIRSQKNPPAEARRKRRKDSQKADATLQIAGDGPATRY